jgi:hypothetical protein
MVVREREASGHAQRATCHQESHQEPPPLIAIVYATSSRQRPTIARSFRRPTWTDAQLSDQSAVDHWLQQSFALLNSPCFLEQELVKPAQDVMSIWITQLRDWETLVKIIRVRRRLWPPGRACDEGCRSSTHLDHVGHALQTEHREQMLDTIDHVHIAEHQPHSIQAAHWHKLVRYS